MNDELLFWSRYNNSIAEFCNEQLLEVNGAEELVSSMVGTGKDFVR